MEKYRKLTQGELENYGIKMNNSNKHVETWAKKYFGVKATSALIIVNSEYNDEYYTGSVQTILVYDKDNNELIPLRGMSVDARKNLPSVPSLDNEYDRTEAHEDIVVVFNVPDLYVKENVNE